MSRSRQRLELRFIPEWEGEIEGFVVKFIAKNLWRVDRIFEYEDAFQEAYIVFLGCVKYYDGKVDNPAWFMALFKQSLFNRFNDLSKKSSKAKAEVEETEFSAFDVNYYDRNLGELLVLLEQAPEEIKNVLVVLLDSPQEVLFAYEEMRANGGKGESSNKFLCHLINADPSKINLKRNLQEYLV